MTKRLVSKHAEDIGGRIVEPGQEFDEDDADAATVERLEKAGKLADVEPQTDDVSPPKSKTAQKGE